MLNKPTIITFFMKITVLHHLILVKKISLILMECLTVLLTWISSFITLRPLKPGCWIVSKLNLSSVKLKNKFSNCLLQDKFLIYRKSLNKRCNIWFVIISRNHLRKRGSFSHSILNSEVSVFCLSLTTTNLSKSISKGISYDIFRLAD